MYVFAPQRDLVLSEIKRVLRVFFESHSVAVINTLSKATKGRKGVFGWRFQVKLHYFREVKQELETASNTHPGVEKEEVHILFAVQLHFSYML